MTDNEDLGPRYEALLQGPVVFGDKLTDEQGQFAVWDIYANKIVEENGKPLKGMTYKNAKAKADEMNQRES